MGHRSTCPTKLLNYYEITGGNGGKPVWLWDMAENTEGMLSERKRVAKFEFIKTINFGSMKDSLNRKKGKLKTGRIFFAKCIWNLGYHYKCTNHY